MKIAILGCRGIPNHYGGFEQFAEILALGLKNLSWDVTVYNSHNHPFQEKEYNKVKIIHKFDPEHTVGTFGQFIYDFYCIMDSRKQNFDIIYQLGYTSSSIWGTLLPFKKSKIVTNMDGLEWKRTKYSKPVRKYLKIAEYLAIKFSNYYIADSIGIKKYLNEKYNIKSLYIPYGANEVSKPNKNILNDYNLIPLNYDMLIARIEPENNIEIILDAYTKSNIERKFLVIGNVHKTNFGKYILKKFKKFNNICFLGTIYDNEKLDTLRYFSNIYFHGHSVGGTNPSLIEAMAASCLICYHNNTFNKNIIQDDGYPFSSIDDLIDLFKNINKNDKEQTKIDNNLKKLREIFNWELIINQYDKFFKGLLNK